MHRLPLWGSSFGSCIGSCDEYETCVEDFSIATIYTESEGWFILSDHTSNFA